MVYKFDPIYFNGTIFELDDKTWEMSGDWMGYRGRNEPIPASCFPQTLTFEAAGSALPDMFHTARDIVVFSEPARLVMERRAPGQVEFIPVDVDAPPKVAARLDFADAYYFVNFLGRAQRLQWLEMPYRQFPSQGDGIEWFGPLPGLSAWMVRKRSEGEPLIWRDDPWIVENKRYSAQSEVFVEDALWRELDMQFPDQLNALKVGG
jgi:hypothetical protein